MKLKLIHVIGIVIALLGLFYILGRVSTHGEIDRLSAALSVAQNRTDSVILSYETTIDGMKQTIYQGEQMLLTEREAKELAIVDKEKYRKLYLKKINEVTILEGQVTALLDSLENNIQIIYVEDSIPCAKLPFHFFEKNEFIDLSGNVTADGIVGLDVVIPMRLDITVGQRRKQDPKVVSVGTNSPYVVFEHINSTAIKEKDPWYTKPWVKVLSHSAAFTLGVMAGQ